MCDSAVGVARAAADVIEGLLAGRPAAVIGFAAGDTMTGLYDELAARCEAGRLSFARAQAFALDEYVGLAPEDPQSFSASLNNSLLSRVDFAPAAVDLLHGHATDPAGECQRYETAIAAAGGIDLQLLGIGRNGHIAFNEPGSAFNSRTRQVYLSDDTRQANQRFFPGAQPPATALTQGLGTICEARQLVLLAIGPHKATAVGTALEGPIIPEIPASVLQHHPNALVLLDPEAASQLH